MYTGFSRFGYRPTADSAVGSVMNVKVPRIIGILPDKQKLPGSDQQVLLLSSNCRAVAFCRPVGSTL
jgi:hypothetical protein